MVGGISAGANLTTIVTHLYRDDKLLPPLTGAYVSIPGCIPPDSVPEKYKHLYLSREQNQNAPILGQNAITWFESKEAPESHPNTSCQMLNTYFRKVQPRLHVEAPKPNDVPIT